MMAGRHNPVAAWALKRWPRLLWNAPSLKNYRPGDFRESWLWLVTQPRPDGVQGVGFGTKCARARDGVLRRAGLAISRREARSPPIATATSYTAGGLLGGSRLLFSLAFV
jgi:hypothetical protein